MPSFISLAQWTRADGYEPEGWEFESLTRYKYTPLAQWNRACGFYPQCQEFESLMEY